MKLTHAALRGSLESLVHDPDVADRCMFPCFGVLLGGVAYYTLPVIQVSTNCGSHSTLPSERLCVRVTLPRCPLDGFLADRTTVTKTLHARCLVSRESVVRKTRRRAARTRMPR